MYFNFSQNFRSCYDLSFPVKRYVYNCTLYEANGQTGTITSPRWPGYKERFENTATFITSLIDYYSSDPVLRK